MTDNERATELLDWLSSYAAHRQFGAAGLERAECLGRIALAFQEVRAERDAELQRAMADKATLYEQMVGHESIILDLRTRLDAMQSPEVVSRVAQAIREAMGRWASNEDPSVVCARAALAAAVGGTKP